MNRQRGWQLAAVALFAALIIAFFFPWLIFCLCVAAAGISAYVLFAPKPHPFVLALLPRDTARGRSVALLASSLVLGAFSTLLIANQMKTAAANRQVAVLVTQARLRIAEGLYADAEQKLKEALDIRKASDRAAAETLLVEVKEKQAVAKQAAGEFEANRLLERAKQALEG